MGTIILFIFAGMIGLSIWAVIKNAKAALSGFVGFSSLMAIIPMFPLLETLAHISEMSSHPSTLIVTLVLIVCLIGYAVLIPLCAYSAVENCKSTFENYAKFTKTIFCVSVVVSATTLITLLISLNLEFGFGKKISDILFSTWDGIDRGLADTMFNFEIVSTLLVLVLSVWGLFAKKRKIKKEGKVTSTDKQDKATIKIPNISSEDIAKGAETLKQNTANLYNKIAPPYQGLFNRTKQILLSPQSEFHAIEQEEEASHKKTLISYVLPLLLIPALFAFVGYGLVGYSYMGHHFSNVGLGFRMAIVQVIVLLGGVYLSAGIINAIADNFGATKNFNRVFSLVAYAYTPMFLAGIFHILPSLWWLVLLLGLYGLYLLFIGLKPMLKPAEDKAGTYSIISLAVTVVGYIILFQVLKAIMLPNFFFH